MRRRDFFRSIAGSAALAAAVPAVPLLARLLRGDRQRRIIHDQHGRGWRMNEPAGYTVFHGPPYTTPEDGWFARGASPAATAIEKQAAYQARRATEALGRKIAQQWDGVSI